MSNLGIHSGSVQDITAYSAKVISINSDDLGVNEALDLKSRLANYLNDNQITKDSENTELWIEFFEITPESPYTSFINSIQKIEDPCIGFDASGFDYETEYFHDGAGEFPVVGDSIYELIGDEYVLYTGEDDNMYVIMENGFVLIVSGAGEFQYAQCE